MMPEIPSSISSVFQPAIAIYSNAAADSVAENFVVEPISLALADSIFIAVSVASAPFVNESPISSAFFTIAGKS